MAKKKPCDDCPWSKKSLPGWLGPHSLEEFQDFFNLDYPYPCHQTFEKPNEHVCVGLAHTRNNSCKRAKLPGPLKEMEDDLRGKDNECFDNLRQFMQHHDQFDKD